MPTLRSSHSAQYAIQRRQAEDHCGGDQRVAYRAEYGFAGLAEQRSAEPDADGIDRADHHCELDRIHRDQSGRGVADAGKEIRRAEEQHDIGAGDDGCDGTAEPVADDRRAAGLGQPAAKAG